MNTSIPSVRGKAARNRSRRSPMATEAGIRNTPVATTWVGAVKRRESTMKETFSAAPGRKAGSGWW